MSDLNDEAKVKLSRLQNELKTTAYYFETKLAEVQKELEEVTNALQAFANQAVEEVKAVAETVKEEVKKAAPKRSTKKSAEKDADKADSSKDSDK